MSSFSAFFIIYLLIEAVVQRCSVKRVFLKIWGNSQENTSARVSFLMKLQGWGTDIQIFDMNKQTQNIWKTVNKNLLLLTAVEK